MRIVLKISGEYLKDGYNISEDRLKKVLDNIKELKDNNELIIVVGGGNFWRGRNKINIDSRVSDYIGMLGTNMNALALFSYLNKNSISSSVYSAFEIENVIEKENKTKVEEDLKKGKVIVFGGGLGYPGISTDMTTLTKAEDYNSDLVLMAKNVDAIYNKDPNSIDAVAIKEITNKELYEKFKDDENFNVFDKEALLKIKDMKTDVYIYNSSQISNIKQVLNKETGTFIKSI